jgi:hypothetical protein
MTIAPQDFLVTQALFALDAILPPWPHKVQLFIVGGYALQLAGVRKDPTEATDVDYIGQTFTGETKAAIDEVGLKFGLGKGWLNNDLFLVGSESVADIEFAVGPIEFVHREDLVFNHFDIFTATAESVLRMKIQAVDTTLVPLLEQSGAAEYVRPQDFSDIKAICTELEWDASKLARTIQHMADEDRLLAPEETKFATMLALKTPSLIEVINQVRAKFL